MPAQGPLPSYMGAKQTTKNNIANLYMNNWKTMIAAAAICLCCPHEAQAIRAYPHPVTVMQPDGTTITVRIHGDENLHYTTTTDGFMLERDEAGFFRYVSYDFVTGQRTLTAQRAHDMAARTAAETALTATLADARQISLDMRARRTAPAKAPARTLKTRAMQGGIFVFASAHLTREEDVPEKLFSRYIVLDGLGRIGTISGADTDAVA